MKLCYFELKLRLSPASPLFANDPALPSLLLRAGSTSGSSVSHSCCWWWWGNAITTGVPSHSLILQSEVGRSWWLALSRLSWSVVLPRFQWFGFSTEASEREQGSPLFYLISLPSETFRPLSPQPQTAVVSRKFKPILLKTSLAPLSLVKHRRIGYGYHVCPCP